MKEIPILFSAPMVLAILDGRKTQTRRVVKGGIPEYERGNANPPSRQAKHVAPYFDAYRNQPHTSDNPRAASEYWCWWDEYDRQGNGWLRCPYGKPGDRLWVRETTIVHASIREQLCGYVADGCQRTEAWEKQMPSIHMRRAHSRITLQITEVRVQRLHEISEEDAVTEGVEKFGGFANITPYCNYAAKQPAGAHNFSTARASFMSLWSSINGSESYAANPLVWAITFKRVQS
jgi:hypothetical protein